METGARADAEGVGLSLRSAMSCFPTGVTVVATRGADGQPVGLTVNSFTSVSLDPPLVLVCINRSATFHDSLIAAGGFTVSVLSQAQADIAARFATGPSEERFHEVEWSPAPSGNPVLADSAAWLDCAVHDVVPAGDHTILVGRAIAVDWTDEPSLLFYRGQLGSATP